MLPPLILVTSYAYLTRLYKTCYILRTVVLSVCYLPLQLTTLSNMKAFTATALALVAPATALLRFPCAQLVIDRLDPLVTPGQAPSPHLHQILGGNSFNVTMDPEKDMPGESTCTSCQFSEDFSVSNTTHTSTRLGQSDEPIELLDSRAILQSPKRHIQARPSNPQLRLQRRQRRHDSVLHARWAL